MKSGDAIAEDASRQMPDVPSLTGRMTNGDETAYREFHAHYFDRLLRYLLVVTRDEEKARESLQLTLLRVVKHIRPFVSEAAFWSWLTVLARSAARDEERKARRYGRVLSLIPRPAADDPRDETDSDARLMEALQTGLALLDDDERELLRRKYLEGAPVKTIADELQSTEKAVESRLVRTRRKLKTLILRRLKHE